MAASMKPDGGANFAALVVFIVLDTIAVILRLISKREIKRSIASDDFWMLVSLVFFYVWSAVTMYAVLGISGTLEIPKIPDLGQLQSLIRTLWVSDLFFPLTITSLKISILCFYRSAFPLRWFQISIHVLTVLCVLWLVSGFWVIIFQCTPVRAVYDLSLQGKARCISFGNFVLIYELLNSSIDVAILVLPALVVPKMNLSLRRKVQVLIIFLVGGLVLVTCVLRLVYCYNPKNTQAVPSFSKCQLWSTVQLGVAIICGNLPTYRPLFPRDSGLGPTLSSWYCRFRGTFQSRSSLSSSGRFRPSSNPSEEDVENPPLEATKPKNVKYGSWKWYSMNILSSEKRTHASLNENGQTNR